MNLITENVDYYFELKIPLYLNGNSGVNYNLESNNEFTISKYKLLLIMEKENSDVNYYFKVTPFQTKEEAVTFFKKFHFAMQVENLDCSLWSVKQLSLNDIKIEKRIKKLHEDKFKIDNKTMILPATGQQFSFESNLQAKLIQLKDSDEIVSDIIQTYQQISDKFFLEDNNLEKAIKLYSNSYFEDKSTQFVLWIVILELLNPSEEISVLSKQYRKKLLNSIKGFKNNPENTVEVNRELENFSNIVGKLKYKSISSSLNDFAINNSITFENRENKSIEEYIKESYDVRSKLVHTGRKSDNFNECYNFLHIFIPKLLKNYLDEHLNKF